MKTFPTDAPAVGADGVRRCQGGVRIRTGLTHSSENSSAARSPDFQVSRQVGRYEDPYRPRGCWLARRLDGPNKQSVHNAEGSMAKLVASETAST